MPADIRHIVVLMMENRSFDHLLGWLKHPAGKSFQGLTGTESNPLDPQIPASARVQVNTNADYVLLPGPDHSHKGSMFQLYGKDKADSSKTPTMEGFIKAHEEVNLHEPGGVPGAGVRIMECFDPAKIPTLKFLAENFRTCVNWFCSVPGQTWPNRMYAHSATSDGTADNEKRLGLYGQRTIFDLFSDRKVSWNIFHDGVPQTLVFPSLWDRWFDGRNNFRSMEEFHKKARAGKLPAYSFIEPDHMGSGCNSLHPEFVKDKEERFVAGLRLIQDVYESLVAKPEAWRQTLLVVTFDEHGGFYDHVAPPSATPPGDKDGPDGFTFNRLGARVPTFLVSPWVGKGEIDDQVYDHASLVRMLREHFTPGQSPLKNRDRDSLNCLQGLLPKPRVDTPTPPVLPEVAKEGPVVLAGGDADAEPPHLDGFQQSLIWLGGQYARAVQSPPGASKALPIELAPAVPTVEDMRTVADVENFQADVVSLLRAPVGGAKALAVEMTEEPLSAKDRAAYRVRHFGNLAGDDAAFRRRWKKFLATPASKSAESRRVLVEGDSWFAFPTLLRRNVVDHLKRIRKGWRWLEMQDNGDEILSMLSGRQKARLRECLSESQFDTILFSGGGNDIVGPDLLPLLLPYKPGMSAMECLHSDRLANRLEQIRLCYLDLIGLRDDHAKGTPIVVNGYDYPIPQDKGVFTEGPWMYPYMIQRKIKDPSLQREIARILITRFNDMVAGLAANPAHNLRLAPTTGTLLPSEWGDEIHPTDAGFGKIAEKFSGVL